MVPTGVVVVTSVGYLALLFAIAYAGDRRAARGRSIISSGWVYALSLCVYATSWTYYGSVGRAATGGLAFLPIYLGPTVMAALWWVVLRKIIRICKRYRITSLADFVSSRYDSRGLGQLVTVVAVVGVVPYIALQLKAISTTVTILRDAGGVSGDPPPWADTGLLVALLLAAFTIVFGTRHLDAAERHEGMVAAIAFESVVKLVALVVVGGFVTFGLYGGFEDLFSRAAADPELAGLLGLAGMSSTSWTWLIVLSMLAVLLLPRQWQVAVVENVDERHVRTAAWLVPLYLLLANVFVLPVALAGRITFDDGGAAADAYVLTLPLADGRTGLALLAFVGGLSAATGMVIVETIALSTMVSNSLVLPTLLHRAGGLVSGVDLGRLTIAVRRVAIVVLLLLGFGYFRVAGDTLDLVSIGLISFAAVAQFAPAVIGGLYWRDATARGATAGLLAGFVVWGYTLPLPSLVGAGLVPASFVEEGPFGAGLLAPYSLLGLEGLDAVSHAMVWSMLVNVGLFVGLSLTGRRDSAEHVQASSFVDVYTRPGDPAEVLWRGTVTSGALEVLLARFLGPAGARRAMAAHAARTGRDDAPGAPADADLVRHVETLLTGAVGSASARFMVASVVDEEPLPVSEVVRILDETSQVLAYSRALERKSAELEAATAGLREANSRLQELDRLKDEFVSTVSHELRTPLTSIRAFSEILRDNPGLEADERAGYLGIVVEETERLTRLIDQLLDLSKLESGAVDWHVEEVDLGRVVRASADATAQLLRDRGVTLELEVPAAVPPVAADRDRLVQVVVNLLSNAVKFSPPAGGRVRVGVTPVEDRAVRVDVADNGPGVDAADRDLIFERFRQGGDVHGDRPPGTGLGLPISRQIVEHLGGRLWVAETSEEGATFSFELPVAGAGLQWGQEGDHPQEYAESGVDGRRER
jgi:Na+/proline symporter/signal transduction histidine kinase